MLGRRKPEYPEKTLHGKHDKYSLVPKENQTATIREQTQDLWHRNAACYFYANGGVGSGLGVPTETRPLAAQTPIRLSTFVLQI